MIADLKKDREEFQIGPWDHFLDKLLGAGTVNPNPGTLQRYGSRRPHHLGVNGVMITLPMPILLGLPLVSLETFPERLLSPFVEAGST